MPKHLRSPLFEGYKYPHDYPGHYVEQRYMPMGLERRYYEYAENKTEQTAMKYWSEVKKK
jgi:putative ATPase